MKESRQVCDTWDAAPARKTHISQAVPAFSPRLTDAPLPASLVIITEAAMVLRLGGIYEIVATISAC